MDEYFVYIDEAGDEGFGKLKNASSGGQSNWLLLGGIVVSKENDRFLPRWRDDIMNLFPSKQKRDLHFQKLKHEQRVASCRLLSDKPIGVCVICSDKTTIPHLKPQLLDVYKQKGHLYNYLVRYFLERVTKACAMKSAATGRGCKVHITFSKRGGTDYKVMRDYLFLMRDGREVIPPIRSINWDILNPEDVMVEDHSNRAGLQIADVVTSATYSALEPNVYGDTETRYSSFLKSRFLRENGRAQGTGLTIVPGKSGNKPKVRSFLNSVE